MFILYGTTTPFLFTGNGTLIRTKLSLVSLNPVSGSIADFAANMLLFIPFGCFGALALGRRPLAVRLWLATGLAALLSATVETLQLFTLDRLTSLNDVVANTSGALAGALAAPGILDLCGRCVDRLKTTVAKAPAFYPVVVAGVLICVAAWEPFDVSGDVTGVSSIFAYKARAFSSDPWLMTVPGDEVLQFLRYLLFTWLVSTWLRQLGVRASGIVAAMVGSVAGVVLESTQFVIDSRNPSLGQASVSIAGAIAGALLFRVLPRRRSPMFGFVLLGIATWIGTALQILSPSSLSPAHHEIWLPLSRSYRTPSVEKISHTIEAMLTYFPIGFALPLVVRATRRIRAAAVFSALIISCPIEYVRGWVGGYPDLTHVAGAVVGCLCGAWAGGSGWERFRSYVSGLVESDQNLRVAPIAGSGRPAYDSPSR